MAILVQRCRIEDLKTAAAIPSAALGLASAYVLLALLFIEHGRSCRPPSLSIAYLFVVILTEATRARTYYLEDQNVIAAITTLNCAIKLTLLILECQKKALSVDFDSKAPEDLAGPISQTFFLWLNSLFLTGYKRAFTTTDLGMISSPLYAKSILAKFSNIANGHIGKAFLVTYPKFVTSLNIDSLFRQRLRPPNIHFPGILRARTSDSKTGSDRLHIFAVFPGHSFAEISRTWRAETSEPRLRSSWSMCLRLHWHSCTSSRYYRFVNLVADIHSGFQQLVLTPHVQVRINHSRRLGSINL